MPKQSGEMRTPVWPRLTMGMGEGVVSFMADWTRHAGLRTRGLWKSLRGSRQSNGGQVVSAWQAACARCGASYLSAESPYAPTGPVANAARMDSVFVTHCDGLGAVVAVGVQPEAGPGFGNDDAVAGVARVVAHLYGLVDAEAEDLVGKGGDVLRAVVDEARDGVAVDEDFGGGGDAV